MTPEYGRHRGGMTVKICTHCNMQGTLKKRDVGAKTEHYWCSECKDEKWPDEIKPYTYGIGVYRNAKGETKYTHHNYRNQPEKKEKNEQQLRLARRIKGMSKRDNHVLRKLRGFNASYNKK